MSEIKMKMSLDSSGVKRGLEKSKTAISKFSKSAKEKLGSVATGGIAAIVAGFTLATKGAMDYGKEMLNLSQLANTNFKDFQKQAAGAKTVGIEQDKLADIYKDTSDKLGDFLETGGGGMADYFENIAPLIGQTADEFRGLSGADALQKYYNGLQQANLDQETMTFYMEAIASDSTALIPLLKDGGEAFKKLGQEAENSGKLMEQATAESLKRATAAIDNFKKKAVIKAGEIMTMFAGFGGGGVLSSSDAEKDRDRKERNTRAQGVNELHRRGQFFSKMDAERLADSKTSVEQLTKIMGEYGLTLIDLYRAAADVRKAEKAAAKESAEATEKETAKKIEKIELAKKELALVKPIQKAQEALAKAEEEARVAGLSNAEKLADLYEKQDKLKEESVWLDEDSAESNLELIKNKTKILALESEIKQVRESIGDDQKREADASKRAQKEADDATKEAQEKADNARKKGIEQAEAKAMQGLESDLLDAQIAQRADLVHSIEKEIELAERVKQIQEETGKGRAESIEAAKVAMKIEAGADANQSGFVTPMEQRKWNRKQKELAREQKKINQAEKRAERDKGGNIKKAMGGRERAELRAADRQKRADDRELRRRKDRGEKAEDVLADMQKKKAEKEMKAAERKGKDAVNELKDKRAKAAAAAAKKPKKPENAVVKELKPVMENQLKELIQINKALRCGG